MVLQSDRVDNTGLTVVDLVGHTIEMKDVQSILLGGICQTCHAILVKEPQLVHLILHGIQSTGMH